MNLIYNFFTDILRNFNVYIVRVLSKLYGYIFITSYATSIIFFINNASHVFLKKNNHFDILTSAYFLAKQYDSSQKYILLMDKNNLISNSYNQYMVYDNSIKIII